MERINITGHRYHCLTAIEPAENIGWLTAWRCRCDCGRYVTVRTTFLQSGRAKSCGHLKRKVLTGQTLNGWYVGELDHVGTNRRLYWQVACVKCGHPEVLASTGINSRKCRHPKFF